MALKEKSNNSFLSTLINSGNDSFQNLFSVTINPLPGIPKEYSVIDENITSRIVSVNNLPQSSVTTTEVVYQNTYIPIAVPSEPVSKTLSLSVRMDENYDLYKFFLKSIAHYTEKKGESGDIQTSSFIGDNKYKFDMEVVLYKQTGIGSNSKLEEVFRWVFYGCYVVSVTPPSLSYESSSPYKPNVTVAYTYYQYG